jgi:hypothetical protein
MIKLVLIEMFYKMHLKPPYTLFFSEKLKSCGATPYRHQEGKEIYGPYSFLTSALDGVSGQRHTVAVLYPGERTTSTHWIGGPQSWYGLRGKRK